ncbi:DUF2794 domain-containing protein [Henriciella marina]|uniref:DUF2794 domain-containing protein n=1 Tax=Henriciella marina TaxID=453851 RepID=UPI0003A5BBF3|nr:DUF2794 domain-containing protein [Henriciella marina]
MGSVTPLRSARSPKTAFHRTEMSAILDVYGKMVMAGQARDYAIGMFEDYAVFAIFRRHAEAPTWRIEKVPALRNQQGAYVVYGSQDQVLKRGHEIKTVLKVFETRKFEIISSNKSS